MNLLLDKIKGCQELFKSVSKQSADYSFLYLQLHYKCTDGTSPSRALPGYLTSIFLMIKPLLWFKTSYFCHLAILSAAVSSCPAVQMAFNNLAKRELLFIS